MGFLNVKGVHSFGRHLGSRLVAEAVEDVIEHIDVVSLGASS